MKDLVSVAWESGINSERRRKKKERQISVQHRDLSSNKSAYIWTRSKSRTFGSVIYKFCDLEQVT